MTEIADNVLSNVIRLRLLMMIGLKTEKHRLEQ